MTLAETLLSCAAVTCKKGLPWHLQKPMVVSPVFFFSRQNKISAFRSRSASRKQTAGYGELAR